MVLREIIELLINKESATASEAAHLAVGKQRGITLNTVQSTLKRLQEKGILERYKVRHAYIYEPRSDRRSFEREILGDVITRLMEEKTDAMISAFVDLTERAGEEELERLEALVADGRRTPEPFGGQKRPISQT